MRTVFRSLLAASACLLATRAPRAQDASAANDARRAAVVARVGTEVITAGDLEDRLARVPRFQLRTFGAQAADIKHKFLDQILVRDALLAAGARDRHLDQEVATQAAAERVLSSAALGAARSQVSAAVTPEEAKAYYDAHIDRFVSKERINVWRILCRTREEAQAVIEAAKKDGTMQTFTALAREHSMDKATFLRGGNLGFLDAKGISNEPGVTADPALVVAAQGVKDGEIVAAPVQEGTSFGVVWRRGTIAGSSHGLEESKPQIIDSITRERREGAEKALIDRLRAEKVKEVNEQLLGTFDVSITDGTIAPRHKAREIAP